VTDISQVVPGCKPYTLKWNPVSAGTVSIEIISGATQGTQVPVGKIATGIPNTGSFVWTPEASLGANAFTGCKSFRHKLHARHFLTSFRQDLQRRIGHRRVHLLGALQD
jgi:hypothetical protein